MSSTGLIWIPPRSATASSRRRPTYFQLSVCNICTKPLVHRSTHVGPKINTTYPTGEFFFQVRTTITLSLDIEPRAAQSAPRNPSTADESMLTWAKRGMCTTCLCTGSAGGFPHMHRYHEGPNNPIQDQSSDKIGARIRAIKYLPT
jgi:hypothetical protein